MSTEDIERAKLLEAENIRLRGALELMCNEYSDLMSDTWGQVNNDTPAMCEARDVLGDW